MRSCGQLPFGANDEVMQTPQGHAPVRTGLRVPVLQLPHVRGPQARMMLEPLPGQALALRPTMRACAKPPPEVLEQDRKSTRLNSSHLVISYAVFCLRTKTRVSLHKSI